MSEKPKYQKLAESDEKYKKLVESSTTGIYIHQDEKIVFINRSFIRHVIDLHDAGRKK